MATCGGLLGGRSTRSHDILFLSSSRMLRQSKKECWLAVSSSLLTTIGRSTDTLWRSMPQCFSRSRAAGYRSLIAMLSMGML